MYTNVLSIIQQNQMDKPGMLLTSYEIKTAETYFDIFTKTINLQVILMNAIFYHFKLLKLLMFTRMNIVLHKHDTELKKTNS